MTSVAFIVPRPLSPTIPGRRQVTIAQVGSIAAPITLPITSPEVEITPIGTNWVEAPRPTRQPLLIAASVKLTVMKLTVTVVGADLDDAGGCEEVLTLLASVARTTGAPPLVVAYGTFESSEVITATGMWRLTDMVYKSITRQPVTNSITRADVTLTFTEASDPPTPSGIASRAAPTVAPAPVPGAPVGSAPAGTRSYTVVAGDTLWGISVRFYGTGSRWTAIAQANGITDPRTLAVGQQLQIP